MQTQVPRLTLKKSILSGTYWAASGQIVTAGLRFGITLFLARLLSPESFGLLGMSMVIILILRDVSDMGFGAALVQREYIDEVDLATIFWFNLVVSLLLTALLFAGAAFLARLFGDVRLEPILRILAFLLPINAFVVISHVVLQRELKFRQISWRDIGGEVGFGLVGVPLAFLGLGVWSLIWGLAAQWIFRASLLWLASPYWPTLHFEWSRLRALSSFSIWMFVNLLMARLVANIDYFLIGRFLGASALGYYTLAFQLVVIPIQRITGVLNGVLFPSFAKIQGQLLRLQNGFLQAIRVLTLIMAPISALLFVVAEILVPLLYSEVWLSAVPVVRLLAVASFFYQLDIMTALLNAMGKPTWRAIVLGMRAIVFLVFAWIWGLSHGIKGVALSILVAAVLSTIVQIWVLLRELQLTPLVLVQSLYRPILSSLFAALVIWPIKDILHFQSHFIQTAVLVIVFGAVYLLFVIPGYRVELRQMLGMLAPIRRITS